MDSRWERDLEAKPKKAADYAMVQNLKAKVEALVTAIFHRAFFRVTGGDRFTSNDLFKVKDSNNGLLNYRIWRRKRKTGWHGFTRRRQQRIFPGMARILIILQQLNSWLSFNDLNFQMQMVRLIIFGGYNVLLVVLQVCQSFHNPHKSYYSQWFWLKHFLNLFYL